MPLLVKARSFLRNIFLPHREDVDLDQEVRSHLEMLTDENIRAGMPPPEAQRAARIELGGVEQVKEQVRDSRAGAFLDSLIHDLRFALRQMRRSPGFAVTAVLILTLGIAANVIVFGVLQALVLRSLDVPNADRVMNPSTQNGRPLPQLSGSPRCPRRQFGLLCCSRFRGPGFWLGSQRRHPARLGIRSERPILRGRRHQAISRTSTGARR